MIERLEQLTMAQFIDLVCGELNVLRDKHEVVPESRLTVALRNIVFEYRKIADKPGAESYLSFIDDYVKAKMEVVIFTMCHNLITLNEHGRVREVMIEYGINASSMPDQRVAAEVTSRLERAKSTVGKLEKESTTENVELSAIRSSFDEQTAAMMAHFKFQIDTSTMKATQYAHLVARHNREIKAQLNAMKKM